MYYNIRREWSNIFFILVVGRGSQSTQGKLTSFKQTGGSYSLFQVTGNFPKTPQAGVNPKLLYNG